MISCNSQRCTNVVFASWNGHPALPPQSCHQAAFWASSYLERQFTHVQSQEQTLKFKEIMGNVGCFIEVAGLVQELWCMDSKVKSPTWWEQENVLPRATVKLQVFLRLRKQLKASASSVSFNKWYQRNCWMTWSKSMLCFKPVNQWNCACYSHSAWARTCTPTCQSTGISKGTVFCYGIGTSSSPEGCNFMQSHCSTM